MSTCSAAEIAEKKRIALEKLKAKKAQLAQPTNTTNAISATKDAQSFYKSSPPRNVLKSVPVERENRASSFLNALKHISSVANRQLVRDAIHPYQRPPNATNTKEGIQKPILGTKTTAALAPVFVKSVTCRVFLVSPQRFAIQPSGYHEKLIEVFKQIPSKSYDSDTRIWNFSLNDYDLVQQNVNYLKPDVVIGVIPKNVLKLSQMPPREIQPSCLASIEPTLADKLLPFQREGVCFAIAQLGRIMICDEMGLGKTFQALAVADYYRDNWPLLICCTASTRESWASHVRDLLPNIPLHYIQVLTSNQQYVGDAKVLITSYNMMERHMDKLMQRKFGFLIFDESHMLKNNKAKCTTVANRLASQAKHVILLSGTPALSRPLELFTQLQLIDRKFMNFMDFTSRYCDGKQSNFGWDANGQSNLEELNVVLKLKYMIRRTKADVLPELAEKFRETVVLDPALIWTNEDTKTTCDSFAKSLKTCKGKEKEEILLRFYAQTAEVKSRAVCAYLKSLVTEKIKFIIFAHHRVMLDAICECLRNLKISYVRIDGQTRSDLRAEYINTFQNKSQCKVAVLSLKACNSGITLTAAEMIIFAELDWNPSTLAQAESRAHRIGQQNPVTCRYLMANKTADDVIWNMLKSKQDILKKTGIFCENLQDATHSAAPTMSKKIEQFFSPNKSPSCNQSYSTPSIPKNSSVQPVTTPMKSKCINEYFTPHKMSKNQTTTIENIDIQKELTNLDELFADDDDDEAFRNLIY